MVNIIIPVYNAIDELYDCVLSVIDNTDIEKNIITIIDDCSPDERVSLFLKDLSEQFPKLNILKNEKNIGFAGTCNRGIRESDGDVILLNSDTIVTPFWVEKLSAAAESDPYCATVTPLSNNASICSVPVWNRTNNLPEKLSLEDFSYLIDIANDGIYRQIPVGVGFCFYIKREIINLIGVLDDKIFKDGYGEENDFCYRARAAGYHHLLACNTYIYHKGEASFISTRESLVNRHGNILKKKYNRYVGDTSTVLIKNPNDDICKTIEKIYAVYNFNFDKPFILFVSHGDPFSDDIIFRGGTEFHIQELSKAINHDYNVMALYKHPWYYDTIVIKTITDGNVKEFFFRMEEWITEDLQNSKWLNSLLNALIDAFPIGIIHIQHWYKLTLDVFTVPIERKIPFFVTLHDYYSICPVYDFLPDEEEYCHFADSDERENLCKKCCGKHGILDFERIKKYRTEMEDILSKAEYVYIPSETAAEIVHSVYNIKNVKVMPHGVDDSPQPFDHNGRQWGEKPYRVAMIGVCSKKKGSKNFIEMVKLSAYNPIEWHIFGAVADKDVIDLNNQYPNALKLHGLYNRGALGPLLKTNKIDLIVIASVWPETFSYTLSEAFYAGIPVIGWDIGAVGERIKKSGFGYLVPPFSSPNVMLKKIIEVLSDKREYRRLKSIFSTLQYKTVKEMGKEYIKDYDKVPAKNGILSINIEAVKYILDSFEIISDKSEVLCYEWNGMRRELSDLVKREFFHTTLYYRDKHQSFSEGRGILKNIPNESDFDLEFDISSLNSLHEVRWDIIEGLKCSVKIEEVILSLVDGSLAKYPLESISSNGILNKRGFVDFNHSDPYFIIGGGSELFNLVKNIRISGKWNIVLS